MDLTTGLLKSNEAISQANPVGNFTAGYASGQTARANAITNEKSRWELDNQEKLQKAISMSVNKKGNLIPWKLSKNGHEMGIDQQVLAHAVEYLPKQWESIRKITAEKNAIKATNAPGAERIEKAVQDHDDEEGTGDKSWMEGIPEDNTSTQSSSTATATPPAKSWTTRQAGVQTREPAQQIADQTAAPSGFATPSKEGATMDATNGMVGNAGLMKLPAPAEEAAQSEQSENIFQIANDMPAMAPKTVEPQPVNSPVKIADLSAEVQRSIKTSMEQSGLLKAGSTIEEAQAQIDNDVKQIMAKAVVPTSDQYIGADGLVDIGAYNKAVAEYPAKQAALLDEVKTKYGKMYGDLLAQKIAVEGNARAAEANTRAATQFDQTQSVVSEANKEGYDLVTQDNVGKYQEVRGAYNALENSKKEIEHIRSIAKTLSDDEFNSQFDALMATIKGSEGINSLAGDEALMSNMRKDKTFGQMASESEGWKDFVKRWNKNALSKMTRGERLNSASKLIDAISEAGQVRGKLDVYKSSKSEKNWADKPAASSSTSKPASASAKKPGETTAEYLKRIRGR